MFVGCLKKTRKLNFDTNAFNFMKKSLSLLILLLFCISNLAKSAQDHTQLKIAVDGMAVNNALFALSVNGGHEKAKIYHEKIDQLLDELATHNTSFRKDVFPVDLIIKSENEAYVKLICAKLSKVLIEVRDYAKASEKQFDLADFPLILTLKSENPGDYYIGINPNFTYTLNKHPFKNSIEELQLQDVGFVGVMAGSDTSLWNMVIHCPNLKIITLFAAEIDDAVLTKLNLARAKKLQSLELSENTITKIPANFNVSNSLLYLSLRRNKLHSLPQNLSNWTNLRYLHLGSNQFDGTERLRIQKALPNTKIIF